MRGLLRLGVLPGLCGGVVLGRGEGEIHEVARNVGEVRNKKSVCHFIETGERERDIFELQLF